MRSTMTEALARDSGCLNWMVTVGAGTRVFWGHAAGSDTVPPDGGVVESTPKVELGVVVGVVGLSQATHVSITKGSRVG
jgi:hypothetical protein